MEQRTLVFDASLDENDLEHYHNCPGVVGVSAYQNVLNLYYAQPPSNQQLLRLAEAVAGQFEIGVTLVSEDVIEQAL